MFFTRRHIKEAKHYRHALQRLINYKRDILPAAKLKVLEELLAETNAVIKDGSRERVAELQKKIDEKVGEVVPPPPDAGLRENVEVFLVAIIVAAGVRAYFLQPFKIPTGSMQPTLFGIVAAKTNTPPPNIAKRAFEMVWLGRTYLNEVAKEDDTIQKIEEKTYLNFFTFTTIYGERTKYTLFAPKDTLSNYFGVVKDRPYRKGEAIAQGYIDTGDQVFVDKASYNFTRPARGNVFVFKTTGILRIEEGLPSGESQHYIKRLAGLPGDTLRIDHPRLFINGSVPELWVFQRVMSEKNGYRGYSNPSLSFTPRGVPFTPLLSTPEDTFTVPDKKYFALGDNSYNSSDSRYWGPLPQNNIAGRGLFVYWPFSSRWGLIR